MRCWQCLQPHQYKHGCPHARIAFRGNYVRLIAIASDFGRNKGHNVIAVRRESPDCRRWLQARGRAYGAAFHSAQAESTTALSTLCALLQNKFALLLELGPVDLALGEALL